jgi:2-oxoglutarate ferredoxin oxidoreductase subunit beta
MPVTGDDYASAVENMWCPGCGNFPILNALKQVLADLSLAPHRVVLASGIGQAPKLPHYLRCNCFNGLHGREIASATGLKIAADDLKVIVHAGDGGAYGEGGNHFLHAIRRNVDMTLCVHDNRVYGLTKGQASPTTPEGTDRALDPHGVLARALNPLALAISQGCSFVAQATAARVEHLMDVLKRAIGRRGFALVNILQPCVSYNHVHTYKYFKEHGEILGDDWDPTDRVKALELVMRDPEKLPLGVIYTEERPTFDERELKHITHPLRDAGVDPKSVEKLFDQFR